MSVYTVVVVKKLVYAVEAATAEEAKAVAETLASGTAPKAVRQRLRGRASVTADVCVGSCAAVVDEKERA